MDEAAARFGASVATIRRDFDHLAEQELLTRTHGGVVPGGVARDRSYELTGPLSTAVLDQLMLGVAILGVDAVDPAAGATAHHEGEATINRMMASRAQTVIVAAALGRLDRLTRRLRWVAGWRRVRGL